MTYELLICLSICLTTFLVWILAIISSVSMRRLGRLVTMSRSLPVSQDELPPISIIITSNNQEYELRQNLPLILDQYYPNFEVIVVDMASKDGTKDLLETMEEEYVRLRHTFTPKTSRDVSLTRLAITLGMKAATNPWVIITSADCTPISHTWVLHMANVLKQNRAAKIVMGYTRYDRLDSYAKRKAQHFWLWQQMKALTYASKHGAYRSAGDNILYSRDLFMEHQGFASHANLLTGATDIMLNLNSTKHNLAICTHPEALLCKSAPKSSHQWKQERLFFQETRKHFRRKHLYRMRYAYRVLLHSLYHLLLLASIGVGICEGQTDTRWYAAIGGAVLLALIHLVVQGNSYNYTARLIDDRTQNHFSTALFISLTPFWDLASWLSHKCTSEKQFRKKFI